MDYSVQAGANSLYHVTGTNIKNWRQYDLGVT